MFDGLNYDMVKGMNYDIVNGKKDDKQPLQSYFCKRKTISLMAFLYPSCLSNFQLILSVNLVK